jgi:hypothetical protein
MHIPTSPAERERERERERESSVFERIVWWKAVEKGFVGKVGQRTDIFASLDKGESTTRYQRKFSSFIWAILFQLK